MAFNLLADAKRPVSDWGQLAGGLRTTGGILEFFPIPAADTDEADALGISLPGDASPEEGWKQLQRVIQLLHADYAMEVTDLHSGRVVSPDDLSELRALVLGSRGVD